MSCNGEAVERVESFQELKAKFDQKASPEQKPSNGSARLPAARPLPPLPLRPRGERPPPIAPKPLNISSAAAALLSPKSAGFSGTVRQLAAHLEKTGLPITPIRTNFESMRLSKLSDELTNQRPDDDDGASSSDDGDITDNDEDSSSDEEQDGPESPRFPRRTTSLYVDSAAHLQVVNELKNRRIGRNNNNECSEVQAVAKRRNSLQVPEVRSPPESSPVLLRNSSSPHANSTSVASNSSASSNSIAVDRDSITSIQYHTGDPKEDKRLKDLHICVREFRSVQKTFVTLLRNIGEAYPEYVVLYGRRLGKEDLLETETGQKHVIYDVKKHFLQILPFHEMLLQKMNEKYNVWNSEEPNFAEILFRHADYLKVCNSFLKEKGSIADRLQQCLQENKDLALATQQFEKQLQGKNTETDSLFPVPTGGQAIPIGKNTETDSLFPVPTGGQAIPIVQHLDAVHQNVVRYKLMMERYRSYLRSGTPESDEADKAIAKLSEVSNTVNNYLADADADQKLLDLHRRLQGSFDVFKAGRKLLYQGEVRKQTRRDLQARYLILFSDTLLICRYSIGSDSFDPSKMYILPMERVRVRIEDHEDYETEFVVVSPSKSSAFNAKSKHERDIWVARLSSARHTMKSLKKHRLSIISDTVAAGTTTDHSLTDSPVVESKEIVLGPESSSTPVPERVSVNEKYDAVWIPDYKATKCLMTGCDTKFNMVRRKHHCRQCGWLICRHCVGYAPVRKRKYDSQKVCPQCYREILESYKAGKLFPADKVKYQTTSGDIVEMSKAPADYKPQDSQIRVEIAHKLIPLKNLFTPPTNEGLSKSKNQPRISSPNTGNILVFGKVFVRNRKGSEVQRWGRLLDGMVLQFFEAELDDEPVEKYFIFGYKMTTVDSDDDGGKQFELRHHNQVKTERKDEVIVFRVTARSAEKWHTALCAGLSSV
uniref:FYVE-type domain-containing protein n=1 Tax=Steinernema glaseri TaxID=37863 RepID=A0A1I7ZB15_9BILA